MITRELKDFTIINGKVFFYNGGILAQALSMPEANKEL